MKFFPILVFLALVQAQLAATQGESIKDIVEAFLERLRKSIPDPYELPEIDVAVPENDYVSAYLNITNGYVSGLRKSLINVKYEGIIFPIPNAVVINATDVELNQKILSGFKILNAPDYTGDVLLNTVTTDLIIEGDVSFNLLPLRFSLTSLKFYIGGIKFTIEGLVSERFSNVLSRVLTRYVYRILNAFQEPISAILLEIINDRIDNTFTEMYSADPQLVLLEKNEETSVQQLKRFFETLEQTLN